MRQVVLVAALVAAFFCNSCSLLKAKPETADQAAAIAAAQTVALNGCKQLATSLKTQDVAFLQMSLTVVNQIARGNPDIAGVASALSKVNTNVAPYAPAIVGLTLLAVSHIPQATQDSTIGQILLAVTTQCEAGLA